MSRWDPAHYLAFGDERLLPALDLIAALPPVEPGHVVDLGCGTGEITATLASKWPRATVVGVDLSPEMLSTARRAHPRLRWVEKDIASWSPQAPVDLIFSNSALHWLDDHGELFPRLAGRLAPGGLLAVQMPNNWHEPTHTLPAEILDGGRWPEEAVEALPRRRVSPADSYRGWLPGAEVWEETYEHRLSGDDPVYEWAIGSFLRPPLALMGDADRSRFGQMCRAAYREAYPRRPDGSTILSYRRIFIVATATWEPS